VASIPNTSLMPGAGDGTGADGSGVGLRTRAFGAAMGTGSGAGKGSGSGRAGTLVLGALGFGFGLGSGLGSGSFGAMGSIAGSSSNSTGSVTMSIYLWRKIIENAIDRPRKSTTDPLPSRNVKRNDCSCCPAHSMNSNGLANLSTFIEPLEAST
jgi:hypothetical protein